LKKYLNALADANVTRCVVATEVVQLDALVESPSVVTVAPEAAASILDVVIVPRSVATVANAVIVSPADRVEYAVTVEPWCAAIVSILVKKLSHCVAVIVDPADTDDSVEPVSP
jgi:hypothetical protein